MVCRRSAKPGAKDEFRKEPVADRWRLTRALGLTNYPWYDPYNQNTLKADRPIIGNSWFFNSQPHLRHGRRAAPTADARRAAGRRRPRPV